MGALGGDARFSSSPAVMRRGSLVVFVTNRKSRLSCFSREMASIEPGNGGSALMDDTIEVDENAPDISHHKLPMRLAGPTRRVPAHDVIPCSRVQLDDCAYPYNK